MLQLEQGSSENYIDLIHSQTFFSKMILVYRIRQLKGKDLVLFFAQLIPDDIGYQLKGIDIGIAIGIDIGAAAHSRWYQIPTQRYWY